MQRLLFFKLILPIGPPHSLTLTPRRLEPPYPPNLRPPAYVPSGSDPAAVFVT